MASARELRKGAQHANYEIGMLLEAEKALCSHSGTTELVRRALLESWALHLRALIEFFHPKPNQDPDTVRAEWYTQDPALWSKQLPKLSVREKRRRKALHKHLAHISYLRDARKTHWSPSDHHIVTRRLRVFLAHLAPKYRRIFTSLRSM